MNFMVEPFWIGELKLVLHVGSWRTPATVNVIGRSFFHQIIDRRDSLIHAISYFRNISLIGM